MSGIYQWAKNIAYFLMFLAVLGAVLPGGKYDKYIRLFSGILLILTVVSPLTQGLHLEEKMARSFEALSFRQDVGDFRGQLEEMESKRLAEIQMQYETVVSQDVIRVAGEQGVVVKNAEVKLDMNPESEYYGHITDIAMAVEGEKESGEESLGEAKPAGAVMVEKIEIGEKKEAEEQKGKPVSEEAVLKLQKELSGYYGLEADHVEIKWEDDEG